jgi:hypothetical protein
MSDHLDPPRLCNCGPEGDLELETGVKRWQRF